MADISKQAIANRLQELRRDKGVTLEELAAVVDASKQAASNWVRTGRISSDNLHKIANHYGYSLAWLLTGEGPQYINDVVQPEPQNITTEEKAMLDVFRQLSKEERKNIKAVADAMVKPKPSKQMI